MGKKRNNKYLPTTLHLSIFPLRKQTNKKHPFFVITQKKSKPLFFVTSLKKKKASFKKICLEYHRPPLRIPTFPLYSTPYGTEKLELIVTPISMFQTVPSMFFIVRSVLFQLKLSMFQLPSVTKLFFFFWLW